ncbi:hypothetical protein ASF10_20420 [Flavobacterium sp. Leaf82]|uniref:hypothetical protein n=1 Tax=unclassified Flavobacterium TaxID=196869 RepID=UPI0006FE65B8|nr:hypothetical protein [Flavobacterium sp. Leaf82]KQO32820.1 hypothetical protein ASF10_20420 [Flavobacterium sp. Leaf82]
MKKYYIVIVFLIVSNIFSQNKKYDTILFNDIKLNEHQLFFKYESIRALEKCFGKLIKKENSSEYENEIPLTRKKYQTNKFSNNEVSLLITKDSVFVYYLNFEVSKKEIVLKYKGKKIILSEKFKLSQFKSLFPDSYQNASGLPVVSFDQAAGVSLIIKNKNIKAYMNFAFYDGILSSVVFSKKILTIRD